MRKKVGLLACSFALEEGNEPNKCNRRLAKWVSTVEYWARFERGRLRHRLMVFARRWIVGGRSRPNTRRYDEVVVVSQWEVEKGLSGLHARPDIVKVVERFEINPETATDIEELVAQAIPEFKRRNVEDVIIVAHAFQRAKVRSLLRKAGFRPIWAPVGWIGFDWTSDQWWTRDFVRFGVYIVLQSISRLKYGAPVYKSGKVSARSLLPKKVT